MRLLQALALPESTARSLELVISGDPALATAVLTSAEVPFSLNGSHQVSVRDAVILLGTEALKAIALSVSLRSLHSNAPVLAKGRFERHSVAVAFIAKYLFARNFLQQGQLQSTMTQDEVYAVGLLHDLGFLLFASQDPKGYEKLDYMTRRAASSMAASFRNAYQRDLCDLVPSLFDRWPHMGKLTKSIVSLGRPWEYPEEQDALRAILAADYVVTVPMGMAIENRAITEEPRPEIASLCDEAMLEIEQLKSAVEAHFLKCGLD